VACLSGLSIWFVWYSSKTTSPELESVKFRNWMVETLNSTPPQIIDYTSYSEWMVFLPLAVICSVMFSVIRPMPRFLLWMTLTILSCVATTYGLLQFNLMLPFGGPLNLLIYCYLCGTLIHLETERIERSRAMALALQTQAEEERKRIANDLHDETLPSLSRVMRLADGLATSEDNADCSREIRSSLEATIEEMRRVINDLHPAILQNLGLAAGLSSLAERFDRDSEIKITFLGQETQLIALPSFSALCIYRIAQEALNNIEKHSGATLAEIALSLTDNVLHVSISDNGKGDGKVSARSESFGVRNIMHRASLIGARVEWLKPKQYSSGTMLVLTMPCTTGGSESFYVSSTFGTKSATKQSEVDPEDKKET
jgi:signal transduction histidine kinase